MENENIQYVNLSLSTKKREETLQEWLNNTELRVYSSYNNLLNSLDYPSMYENVIASGCDNSKIYRARRHSMNAASLLITE